MMDYSWLLDRIPWHVGVQIILKEVMIAIGNQILVLEWPTGVVDFGKQSCGI
jgi:hypothetical protein